VSDVSSLKANRFNDKIQSAHASDVRLTQTSFVDRERRYSTERRVLPVCSTCITCIHRSPGFAWWADTRAPCLSGRPNPILGRDLHGAGERFLAVYNGISTCTGPVQEEIEFANRIEVSQGMQRRKGRWSIDGPSRHRPQLACAERQAKGSVAQPCLVGTLQANTSTQQKETISAIARADGAVPRKLLLLSTDQ
jgi:hypothetical protein